MPNPKSLHKTQSVQYPIPRKLQKKSSSWYLLQWKLRLKQQSQQLRWSGSQSKSLCNKARNFVKRNPRKEGGTGAKAASAVAADAELQYDRLGALAID